MIKLNPAFKTSSPTSKKSPRSQSNRTAKSKNVSKGDLEFFLDELHRIPLLNETEEQTLARKIFLYRQAFQRLILKEPEVIEHLAELLTQWDSGKIRLDFVCNIALSEMAKRKKLEPAIRKSLPRLKQLAKKIRQSHNASQKSASQKSAGQKRQLHRQCIQLIESLSIRPRSFESAPIQNRKSIELLAEYRTLCRKMTNANLRLVAKVARQICGQSPWLVDMIQEGTLGLMHAVTKFDHHRQMRFSTYATPWIRQHIFAALPNSQRTIRIPDSYRSAGKKVQRELDQILSDKEWLEPESAMVIEQVAEQLSMKPEDIRKHILMKRTTGSLDQIVERSPGNLPLGEMIPSRWEGPQIVTQTRERHEQTMSTISNSLNEREQDVISLRYGLNDGKDRSLAEVGRVMGITRERVRQIEKPALEKLGKIQLMCSMGND